MIITCQGGFIKKFIRFSRAEGEITFLNTPRIKMIDKAKHSLHHIYSHISRLIILKKKIVKLKFK